MVVRNLFENAVLYSPQSPDISVRLVKAGTSLQLSVQDHGRGLDQKEQKRCSTGSTAPSLRATMSAAPGLVSTSWNP